MFIIPITESTINPHHVQRQVAVCSSSAVCNRIRPTPRFATPSQNSCHDPCVPKASARSAVPCDKGIVLSNRNTTSGITFLTGARLTTAVPLCVAPQPAVQEHIHTYAVNPTHKMRQHFFRSSNVYLDALPGVFPLQQIYQTVAPEIRRYQDLSRDIKICPKI